MKERDHFEDKVIDLRIMLKRILNELVARIWNDLIWLSGILL
jgi:hypothetical protein